MRTRIGWLVLALSLVLARSPALGEEASTMPITLTLEDYNATEKIGYPPRKLSTASAPDGVDPSVGDIAYYAPWGNLAIFYKDFGYSRGLIGAGPDRFGHRGHDALP